MLFLGGGPTREVNILKGGQQVVFKSGLVRGGQLLPQEPLKPLPLVAGPVSVPGVDAQLLCPALAPHYFCH